jgi:hypothetical protein
MDSNINSMETTIMSLRTNVKNIDNLGTKVSTVEVKLNFEYQDLKI